MKSKNSKINGSQAVKTFAVLLLATVLVTSLLPPQSAYAAAVTFSPPTTPGELLDNVVPAFMNGRTNMQQITSSGDSVYLIWQNDLNIQLRKSVNNGTDFSNIVSVGSFTGFSVPSGVTFFADPQFDMFGSNIFAAWNDNSEIKFSSSNDDGVSFGVLTDVVLSSTTDSNINITPQITTSGSGDALVVWHDTDDDAIKFRSVGNQGATLNPSVVNVGSAENLPGFVSDLSDFAHPQIAASGDNVYVTWSNDVDILFSNSTNTGQTFSAPQALGDSGGATSYPQIAASGDDVYVVWQQGSDVNFVRSTNNGFDFTTASDIGDGGTSAIPQIALSGNNVHIAWDDSSDIVYRTSSDNGLSLENNPSTSPLTLSGVGTSTNPQISSDGTNVAVVWQEDTTDIIASVSGDSGATFGASGVPTNVDVGGSFSKAPVVSVSGNNVFTGWSENNSPQVHFKIGAIGGPEIVFDQPQYKLSETASITITDPVSAGNATIPVIVSSTSTPGGITVYLDETSSGVFDGSLVLDDATSVDDNGNPNEDTGVLNSGAGDIITATYLGNGGQASIFSNSIDIKIGPNIIGGTDPNIDYGFTPSIQITDPNANLNPSAFETVSVSITSDGGSHSSATITLNETGADTGVFGGTSPNLIFMPGGDYLLPASGEVEITQDWSTQTCSFCTGGIDSVIVNIVSTTDPSGISLQLNETSANSEIFTAPLILTTDPLPPSSELQVTLGDIVSLTTPSNGNFAFNFLVTTDANTNSIGSVAALQVVFPSLFVNDLSISYNPIKSFNTCDCIGGGGGGGGLVRPGLVVNVLAGFATSSGGGGALPGPTLALGALALSNSGSEIISLPQEIRDFVNDDFDPYIPLEPIADIYQDFDFPLSINGNGFALAKYENTIVPQTVRPGEPVEFVLVFYTTSEVAHTSLNFNLGPTRTIAGSDTQVLLYNDKPAEIIDPNGNIATATGSINNDGELKRVATFSITFSESIQWTESDLVMRSWNENLNSGDIVVFDAIQVLPLEEIASEVSVTETLTSEELANIPIWVKNNAEWWATGQIDDSDFISGIQYLVEQDIIKVSQTESTGTATEIPDWVKQVAGFWADGSINNVEFVQTIQWLVTNGLVMV